MIFKVPSKVKPFYDMESVKHVDRPSAGQESTFIQFQQEKQSNQSRSRSLYLVLQHCTTGQSFF